MADSLAATLPTRPRPAAAPLGVTTTTFRRTAPHHKPASKYEASKFEEFRLRAEAAADAAVAAELASRRSTLQHRRAVARDRFHHRRASISSLIDEQTTAHAKQMAVMAGLSRRAASPDATLAGVRAAYKAAAAATADALEAASIPQSLLAVEGAAAAAAAAAALHSSLPSEAAAAGTPPLDDAALEAVLSTTHPSDARALAALAQGGASSSAARVIRGFAAAMAAEAQGSSRGAAATNSVTGGGRLDGPAIIDSGEALQPVVSSADVSSTHPDSIPVAIDTGVSGVTAPTAGAEAVPAALTQAEEAAAAPVAAPSFAQIGGMHPCRLSLTRSGSACCRGGSSSSSGPQRWGRRRQHTLLSPRRGLLMHY